MMCACHLPALVNYMNKTYNKAVNVKGECRTGLSNNQTKAIPILAYSQCNNYSLFQRNLLCETCSGVMCNASEVTTCSGAEPVCQYMSTMNGVTQKFERSCSTYRKCIDAAKNNIFTCHRWFNGPSCVTCCTERLCNKNGFLGKCCLFSDIITSDLLCING
ncbi:uncharacterized protein LOC106878889 [Octopus bimaculoides]|nr:uncharacterized protein LOC106878889 [Octopus bimaculoides]